MAVARRLPLTARNFHVIPLGSDCRGEYVRCLHGHSGSALAVIAFEGATLEVTATATVKGANSAFEGTTLEVTAIATVKGANP